MGLRLALGTICCALAAASAIAEEPEAPKPPKALEEAKDAELKPPKPIQLETRSGLEAPKQREFKAPDPLELESKQGLERDLIKQFNEGQRRIGEQRRKEMERLGTMKGDDGHLSIEANSKAADLRREQMRKEIESRIEEARKELAKRESKGKEEEKKEKDKPKPSPYTITSTEDAALIDLTGKPDKKRKPGTPWTFDPEQAAAGASVIHLSGEKGLSPELKGAHSGNLLPGAARVLETTPGERTEVRFDLPKKKDRSLWERAFGKDAPEEAMLNTPSLAKAGEGANVAESVSSAQLDQTGGPVSLRRRLEAMLASKRLQQESLVRAQSGLDEKDLPPAAVVELDKSGAGTQEAGPEIRGPLLARPAQPVRPPELAAEPESLDEAQMRQRFEARFRDGLNSKDLVERSWAYRFALQENRREAVPQLMEEVRGNTLLAPLAIAALSYLAPEDRAYRQTVWHKLSDEDAQMRKACAEALATLRDREAAGLLIERIRAEKNYHVRKMLCLALGATGKPEAAQELRAVMTSNGEIEEVKAQAALSLAQMGSKEGKEHLVHALSHRSPEMQMQGLMGLVQSGDPDTPGYLSQALESPHEAVWSAAIQYFPLIDWASAFAILRPKMRSPLPHVRWRAALALGFVGSDEGLPYIREMLREGGATERRMGAMALGLLRRKEAVPDLIAALQDPQAGVRKTAALALANMDAKEAVPAILEAAQGAKRAQALPPSLRGTMPDVTERLLLLDAARHLAGEQGKLKFSTIPDPHSSRWPQYDRQLFARQVDLVKAWKLLDVMSAEGRPAAAVFANPEGGEVLLKLGEQVAAGFVVQDLHAGVKEKEKWKVPPSAVLIRGETKVVLNTAGEVDVKTGE